MQVITKNLNRAEVAIGAVLKKYRVSLKDIKKRDAFIAWQAMAGIWKNKKLPDPAKWQKKIRAKWDK